MTMSFPAEDSRYRCRVDTCPDFGDPDFGGGTCPSWHAECKHESKTGNEGPLSELPGGRVGIVRWRCDGCGDVVYDDAALADIRVALGKVQTLAAELMKQWDWLANGHRASDYGHDIFIALGNPDIS